MAHSHRKNRRNFLKLSAKLAALGVTSMGLSRTRGVLAAESNAADLTDYKALVCVYLFGGNDTNNLIVPLDAARYAKYQQLRANIALPPNQLLSPIVDAQGNQWGLHYGIPELHALYGAGSLAFVLNMGQLNQPLTQAQYLAGQNTPTNLFSHSDQTVQAQSGTSTPTGSGWGGRLLDCCGVNDTLAAIATSAPAALFLTGKNVTGNVVLPGTNLGLAGMSFWPQSEAQVRRQAVDQMLAIDGGNKIRQTANKQMADGLQLASALQNASGGGDGLSFPGTDLGNQLKEVARLVKIRSAQGPGRQVFFCAIGGFDLHSGLDWNHWYLLSTLSQAVNAFHGAIQSTPEAADKVTLFTQSEFGRTLQPSGTGADHAWGSHQIVVGGAVKGGVYGQYPTLAFGGPDDADTRGTWIPKISIGQFGATLGKWFGAQDADLYQAFANLDKFAVTDLGFMKP